VSAMVTAVAFSALLLLTVAATRVITRLSGKQRSPLLRHPTDREKQPGQASPNRPHSTSFLHTPASALVLFSPIHSNGR
jgi:hypothetical protein